MLLAPARIKPKSFESRRNSFCYPAWMRLMFTCVFGRYRLLPQSYQYPNLSEGADRVGGQLRGDKESVSGQTLPPLDGVTAGRPLTQH